MVLKRGARVIIVASLCFGGSVGVASAQSQDAYYYFLLGRHLEGEGDEAGALTALDRAAAADPKDFLDLLRRYRAAQAMDDSGNCAQAALVYRSIVSEAPDFTLARVAESEALTRCERLPEAALALEELIKRGEARDSTYMNVALTHHRRKATEAALEWLRKGVQAFPRSAALRHRTGRVLLLLKRPEEAVKELDEALALEPRFLDARLALGLAEEARGRREQARAALQEAQKLAPSSPEAKEAADALRRLERAAPAN